MNLYSGKRHKREFVAFVRDPNVHAGPFRVMARTDGAFVVVDERLPIARRTVRTYQPGRDTPTESIEVWAKAECIRLEVEMTGEERSEWAKS
jgi:hypothetical protein